MTNKTPIQQLTDGELFAQLMAMERLVEQGYYEFRETYKKLNAEYLFRIRYDMGDGDYGY